MSGLLKSMWDNKEELVGGLFDMFTEENVKQNIDENWSSLKNIGISEGLLQGKPTTTEADFSKSLSNTIYNLPSRVPGLVKEVVGAVYNPIDTATGLLDVGQGAMTNATDVFYDAVLPDRLFNLLKENQPKEITKNEKMMESAGEALLDPQVRREIIQQYGLDGLLAWASMPSSAFTLSKKIENKLQNVVTATAPFGNTIGTQIFAGEKAATKVGKTNDLAKAKDLENNGVDAQTIWNETGFAKGQDGNWRFEIDDSGASIKDLSEYTVDKDTTIKAKDYLDHPKLYEAYPELAELNVKPFNFNLEPNVFGYYSDVDKEININPTSQKTLAEYSLPATAQEKLKLGKSVHEFQHPIQNIEGHGTGSSPAAEAGRVLQEEGLVVPREEIAKLNKQLETDKTLSFDERKAIATRIKNLHDEIGLLDRYVVTKGTDNYRNRVLGEIEAFQTQDDIGLTATERAERFPKYLLSDDVLIRGDGIQQGRRLLSDAVRYEGMDATEAQVLAAGYGRKRIMDDDLRTALENKEIIPDYVKEGGLLSEEPVSLRDYAGRSVIFPMADTSATGQTTMEVAGKELAKGSKDEGGQAFALDNPDLAWANDEKAMSTLMNNLTEAQKLSKDPPLIMPWQMGGGAINFSVQMSDTMIQAARANLTDAEMKVIDDKVRAQEYLKHYKDADGKKIKPSEKVKLNPNFKGIKNVDLTELTGMQRIALIGHLDTNAKDKIGSMLEHQLANADPTQLFTDPFTLHNVMEADISRGILDSPHRTYNKAVGGSFEGRIKEPVSLLDLIDAQTKKGVPITTETIETNIAPQNKSLMGQKLHTLLTEERIDKAIKLGEERLKRQQKKKKK